MLAEMPKQGPGEYKRSHDATVTPSLSDLGINKTQSSRWQKQASVPDEAFEKYLATAEKEGTEFTNAGPISLAEN